MNFELYSNDLTNKSYPVQTNLYVIEITLNNLIEKLNFISTELMDLKEKVTLLETEIKELKNG